MSLPVGQKKNRWIAHLKSKLDPLKGLGKNQHPHGSGKLLEVHFHQDLRAVAALGEAGGKTSPAIVEPTVIYTIKSPCFARNLELVIAQARLSLYSLIINYTVRIVAFLKEVTLTLTCNYRVVPVSKV